MWPLVNVCPLVQKFFRTMLGVKEVNAGTMCCVSQPVTLTDLKVVAIVDEQTGSSGRMT